MKDADLTLFPTESAAPYLESVQRGTVAEVWARVVAHYLRPGAVAVDLTHRTGRMWSKVHAVRVVRLDLDRTMSKLSAVADCRYPPIRPLVADAVVFDPPWAEDAGRTGYAGPKYAAAFTCPEEVLALVRPEAWARITRPDGFLFVRCADYHHEGRFVDLSTDLSTALTRAPLAPAWEAWDRVIHVIGGRPPRYRMVPPPKTKKVHSYFLVFRRRGRAPGQGSALDHDES